MTMMSAAAPIDGFRSEIATVNGVRLHYWLGGDPDGQPVILWHGFLATGYTWRKIAPALARAGMAVLLPDMRGYGDSDKPAGVAGYDARALSEECRALVAAIGFGGGRPAIHAAHDMGGLPALLWAADHPDEVAGLVYMEAPVMIGDVIRGLIAYTPDAMQDGSMWWWILPFGPGVPELLVVGNERRFLGWFNDRYTADPSTIDEAATEEYLRTFAGTEGVLGAMGIYRAAFTSIEQTEPLLQRKVTVPVIALGGAKSLGENVGPMIEMVAERAQATTVPDCGHFMPEERPDVVIAAILKLAAAAAQP